MSHTVHYMLIALAVALNLSDRKAVLLSLAIGLNVTFPFAAMVDNSHQFYLVCGVAEVTVGLLALWLNTSASRYVATMCATLCAFHILAYYMNGYAPDSPYRILVKIAEFAEIIACIAVSTPILRIIKNVRSYRVL